MSVELVSVSVISKKVGAKDKNGKRPPVFGVTLGFNNARKISIDTIDKDLLPNNLKNLFKSSDLFAKVHTSDEDHSMEKIYLASGSGKLEFVPSQFLPYKGKVVPQDSPAVKKTSVKKPAVKKPAVKKDVVETKSERPAPTKFDNCFSFPDRGITHGMANTRAKIILDNIASGNHSSLVTLLKPYDAIIVQVDLSGRLTSISVDAAKDKRLVEYTNKIIASRDKAKFFNQTNVFAEVAVVFLLNAISHELGFKTKKNVDGSHFPKRGDELDVDLGGISGDVKSTYFPSYARREYLILHPREHKKKCEIYISALISGESDKSNTGDFSLLANINGFLYQKDIEGLILKNDKGEHTQKDGRLTDESWIPFSKLNPTIDLIETFLNAELRAGIQ